MDNKRVEDLERITKRLMRRTGKTAAVLITPYPISNAVFGEKLSGPILRYMFPCDGIIVKGIVKFGTKPRTLVTVGVRLFNDAKSASKGFTTDRKMTTIQPELLVTAGDCLEVSLEPGTETVTEIWISFLWRPAVKDVEAKSFLIEEMENDLQERTKSLTAEEPLP